MTTILPCPHCQSDQIAQHFQSTDNSTLGTMVYWWACEVCGTASAHCSERSLDAWNRLSTYARQGHTLEAVTARLYEGATLRAEVASAWVYVELGGREWHGATLGEALEGVVHETP